MEHFRKMKKLKESQVEKQLVMTELKQIKKSKIESAKIAGSVLNKQKLSSKNGEANGQAIYTIKNLDQGKIQLINQEDQVHYILKDINQLPEELQKILENIWNDYLSEKQKQEEQFLQACYQGNIQGVRKVLKGNNKYPIDPKTTLTAQGKNGIHLATMSGSYKRSEIIAELKKQKIDINEKTFIQKRTPLMLGCILGNEIGVKALLQNGADTALQDYEGNTALHLACIFNQQQIIEILSEYNPPVNSRNSKGYSPLDYLKHRKTELVPETSTKHLTAKRQRKQSINILQVVKKLSEQNKYNTPVKKSYRITQNDKIKNVVITQAVQTGRSHFNKLSLLGRGAFGHVYLVQNINEGNKYAMKVLDKNGIMQQNILRYAMTQRKILSTINHPFIVKLHYAFQSQTKLYLVMDYCPGGDMLKLIKAKGPLKEETIKKYAAEISLALDALHKAQIIYRDLKPGNVIFDKDGHACLTDFGLSKEASLAHSFCGSTAYLAPEMLWRKGHTKALDWYLLGVLIYECLTGKPPFWNPNKQQLLSNIKSGRYQPLGSEFSHEVKDLIQNFLKPNATKRLGASGIQQIKKHPWFNNIDWKIVEQRKQQMPRIQQLKGKLIKNQVFNQPLQTPLNQIQGWNYQRQK